MAVDQNTLDALRLDGLQVPSGLTVEDLRVEEYTDADGADALRVTVVLGDETGVDRSTVNKIHRLKTSIHDNLLQRGVKLFPYIDVTTLREEAEAADCDGE